MSKKHRDLQPWMDYFNVLSTYEAKGFLQTVPEKNEAYVTEPALYTLAGCSFSHRELGMGVDVPGIMRSVGRLAHRLRVYVGWQSQKGKIILAHPFALHVVKDIEHPAPLFTILITTKRRWWKLWMWHDSIEVINYK